MHFLFILILLSLPNVGLTQESQNLEEEALYESYLSNKYQWLYEVLIDERDRVNSPEKAWRSFSVHLKDNIEYFPDPSATNASNLSSQLPYTVQGTMTYVGFFKGKYKYDLFFEKNILVIEVRVYFTTDEEKNREMAAKFKRAERFWNKYRITTDFPYEFRFKVVSDSTRAHFKVRLKDSDTRGPYFIQWSRQWNYITIAHELGHTMGLGDEYQTLTSKINCLRDYLMCAGSRLAPQYYYHVLRRAMAGWKRQLDRNFKAKLVENQNLY